MLVTFTISGRLVTKWGRYKIFPVLGTALMSGGLFLLSLLTPSTPLIISSIYMVVVGAGIGLVMQVLVVAVQNAVPQRQLGTATSSSTFFRSIGGAFGVAVFGAIFINRLAVNLPNTFRRRRCGPFTAATSRPAPLSSMRFRLPSTTGTS